MGLIFAVTVFGCLLFSDTGALIILLSSPMSDICIDENLLWCGDGTAGNCFDSDWLESFILS